MVVLPLLVVERTGGPGDGNDDHFDEEEGEMGSSRVDAFGPDVMKIEKSYMFYVHL